MYERYAFPFVENGEEKVFAAEVYLHYRKEAVGEGTAYRGVDSFITDFTINYIEDDQGNLIDETPELREAVEHTIFKLF